MGTVLDLVSDALFEIGAIGVGEAISPEDGATGLRYLNRLLQNWSTERLNVYEKRADQIPLTANTASFSIGLGSVASLVTPATPTVLSVPNNAQVGQSVTISGATGTWAGLNGTDTISARSSSTITVAFDSGALTSPITGVVAAQFSIPRPVVIESANFINAAGESFDLRMLSSQEWAKKPSKTATDRIATEIYCDFAYPMATINLWPAGSQTGCKVELWTWRQLMQFLNLAQTVDFPPGYEAAVLFNLAVDLAAAFGRELTQGTTARAGQYKAAIQGINAPPIPGAMTEMLVSQPPQMAAPPAR